MHVPEIDGQLRSQRAWHQLGQGHALLVIGIRNPAALLHQIAVHVANQGHGAAKAERSQAQHVKHQLPQRVAWHT